MLLRNYDNLITVNSFPYFENMTFYTENGFSDGLLCFKDSGGIIRNIARYSSHPSGLPFVNLTNRANTYGNDNLICGSGTTKENYDDYCLENIFTTAQVSNLSHKTSELVYDENMNTFTITYTKVFQALEDIAVGEIGVTSPSINYKTGGTLASCLIYRKVLDTPIEVPANANFVLSFTITVSANPNKPANYDAGAALVE